MSEGAGSAAVPGYLATVDGTAAEVHRLGIDLPVLDVLEVPALADMAARLDEQVRMGTTKPLLRRYRAGSSGASIVLVPGLMGMAAGLNLIADSIAADVDIYLFDYPGHRPGQAPLKSIDGLATALRAEMEGAAITHDVALYGDSLGSWVAFEAARRLSALGTPPLFVGIGDMYSPFFNTKESPLRPSLTQRIRNRVRRVVKRLRRRGTRRSGARGLTPTALMRQHAVSDASEIARRSYDPRPYDGDLLVVVASERAPKFGATLGYERHTTGIISTLRVAGGHSAMHREQAQPIGAAITDMLRSKARIATEPE